MNNLKVICGKLVERMIEFLAGQGATEVEEVRLAEESMRFSLPVGVRGKAPA